MHDRYIDFTFDFGLCTCKLSDMPKDMMLAWTLLPIPQELKYRPYMFFSMNKELKQFGQDLVAVFKKYGIEIVEGSLELKTKPLYRNGDGAIVQPLEITLERLYSYAKRRIDGTYDDIYVDKL